jgi:hypothetical protein
MEFFISREREREREREIDERFDDMQEDDWS